MLRFKRDRKVKKDKNVYSFDTHVMQGKSRFLANDNLHTLYFFRLLKYGNFLDLEKPENDKY